LYVANNNIGDPGKQELHKIATARPSLKIYYEYSI